MIILCCFACKTTYVKYASNYTFKSENGLPNYGNLNYWAAHPWKHDTSDSVPKPLRKDFNADSTIDVFFFIQPAILVKKKPKVGMLLLTIHSSMQKPITAVFYIKQVCLTM